MMKRIIAAALCVLSLACVLASCAKGGATESGRLSVVCTIFPQYDFARQICGDAAEVTMLLSPGKESHTYDPSAKDIMTIKNCGVFIYVGGESDAWVETILASIDEEITVLALTDCAELFEEEPVGDDAEEHEESEYDEHVWTSPKNAEKIVMAMCGVFCEKDPANAELYRRNANEYCGRLEELDAAIEKTVGEAKRKFVVFADRFPVLYFTKRYGLSYYAAFPGCSSKTEPSPSTVANIINKVKSENVPVIFKIELSDGYVAEAVAEATGAEVETFYSLHNISKDDFENGETYISLMEKNNAALARALN